MLVTLNLIRFFEFQFGRRGSFGKLLSAFALQNNLPNFLCHFIIPHLLSLTFCILDFLLRKSIVFLKDMNVKKSWGILWHNRHINMGTAKYFSNALTKKNNNSMEIKLNSVNLSLSFDAIKLFKYYIVINKLLEWKLFRNFLHKSF